MIHLKFQVSTISMFHTLLQYLTPYFYLLRNGNCQFENIFTNHRFGEKLSHLSMLERVCFYITLVGYCYHFLSESYILLHPCNFFGYVLLNYDRFSVKLQILSLPESWTCSSSQAFQIRRQLYFPFPYWRFPTVFPNFATSTIALVWPFGIYCAPPPNGNSFL